MSRILYTPGREKKINRPKRTRIFPAAFGICVALAVIGGIFVLRRPEWQINAVAIEGLGVIPESAVRDRIAVALGGAHLGIIPRSSIALARERVIEDALKKEFPPMRDVAARKRFPSRLDIAVVERRLWGIFCNDLKTTASSSCVAVDGAGYAYADSPAVQGALILRVKSDGGGVRVGEFAVSGEIMDHMRRVMEQMPAIAGAAPLGFEFSRDIRSEFRAAMPDGYRVIFRRDVDLANALRVLKKVLDEEIGDKRTNLDYVDLRFGNKVFYKWK